MRSNEDHVALPLLPAPILALLSATLTCSNAPIYDPRFKISVVFGTLQESSTVPCSGRMP